MNQFTRSCCDPADNIDVNKANLDAFRSAFSFLRNLIVNSIPPPSAAASAAVMDDYVDHLRLPASSRVGVNLTDVHFWWAAFFIVFNPVFWNIVARLEHKTRILTRLCCGQSKLACALLGLVIILLGLWRDHLVRKGEGVVGYLSNLTLTFVSLNFSSVWIYIFPSSINLKWSKMNSRFLSVLEC